jgi:hypothetical protein
LSSPLECTSSELGRPLKKIKQRKFYALSQTLFMFIAWEDDSGPMDDAVGSGDDETAKNANAVRTSN